MKWLLTKRFKDKPHLRMRLSTEFFFDLWSVCMERKPPTQKKPSSVQTPSPSLPPLPHSLPQTHSQLVTNAADSSRIKRETPEQPTRIMKLIWAQAAESARKLPSGPPVAVASCGAFLSSSDDCHALLHVVVASCCFCGRSRISDTAHCQTVTRAEAAKQTQTWAPRPHGVAGAHPRLQTFPPPKTTFCAGVAAGSKRIAAQSLRGSSGLRGHENSRRSHLMRRYFCLPPVMSWSKAQYLNRTWYFAKPV